MDFLRNNRLEIKMVVSSRVACCIVGIIDLLIMSTLLGIHITELADCSKVFGVLGILITLLILAIINFLLAVILLLGVKQNNITKCQFYTISWLFSWLALLILMIIFLLTFLPLESEYLVKVSSIRGLFYTQIIFYSFLLVYKPLSLLFVYNLIMDIVRRRRERQVSIKRPRGNSTSSDQEAELYKLQNTNGNGQSVLPSPNPNSTPFPYGTGTRGRRTSESYERVQGVDDLMKMMEFPTDNHVSSTQFHMEETLLKMEHDFFVKKGTLVVPKKPGRGQSIGGGGSFGVNTSSSFYQNQPQVERVQVAIKVFRQNVDVEAVRRMLLETKILTMFRNHNNVIKLLGFCTENIHKGKMILMLEYTEKGTLEDFLKENYSEFQDLIEDDKFTFKADPNRTDENIYENIMTSPPISPPPIAPTSGSQSKPQFTFNSRTLLNWSFQIANGMEFINGHGVIHGNLMAKNCIVDERNRIKIGNFTFATHLYNFKQTQIPIDFVKREIQLPWRWTAIECMNTDPPSESSFTEKSDGWSYGVVIWEIFSLGCTPYEGLSTPVFFQMLKAGERLEKPPFANSEVYTIMKNCWNQAPEKRPNFTQIKLAFGEILQSLM